ncbi:MAG: hypothetical protein ACU85U_19135 [Gammaproteobacteria bacterium]
MPELTVDQIALLVLTTAIGAIVGWVLRGKRAAREKTAISAGWQAQFEAQQREHARLVDQNKGLMEQVSQFQAQLTDSKNRARELSLAVQEAFQRRDELQREIKVIRNDLETVLSERDELASSRQLRDDVGEALRQKDARIEKLSKELGNWQSRLPPLIERFRNRNEEAERLEAELANARERIFILENAHSDSAANETRIEPVGNPEELTEGQDACNDPADSRDSSEDTAPAVADEADDEQASVADNAYRTRDLPLEDRHEPGFPAKSRDDLKMIKGVGPAIEKTLNEMGIFSFRQIADMNEYDIDRVARRLRGFHSRIYREDWIGQARALVDEAAHA